MGAFIFAVAVIVVYKTFDNFDSIWGFFGKILGILSPFVIGFGLAFLLLAPCRWLENRLLRVHNRFLQRGARILSILVVYLLLGLIVALILVFAIPALARAIVGFVKELPAYFETAKNWAEDMGGSLFQNFDLDGKLEEIYANILSKINIDTVTASLQGVINFTSSLLNIFMAVIISVYMLASRESLIRALKVVCGLFMKEKWINTVGGYLHKAGDIFYKYLYSALLDACLMGVVVSIGLLIFRVPYALLLGMVVGLLNMIPYFGALIGGVGCALIALLSGNIYTALAVAVYILVMQQLDGNLIQPKIIGTGIGIKPIYVLLAITVGGGLFGFWGIVLGVPFMAVLQMLLQDYIQYRNSLKIEPAVADSPPEE